MDLGILAEGCVIIGDNVLFPGAPKFREFVTTDPRLKTVVHSTFLEYDKETPDEVTVSIYDPDNKLDAPPTLLDLAMKVNLGKKIGKNIGNITSKMFNQNPPPTSGKAAYLV